MSKQPTSLPKDFDFIKAFIEISGHTSDVSDDFSEAAAQFLLSSAAGRAFGIQSKHKFSLKDGDDSIGEIGHMFLNTWYCLIGPSRRGRKGTTKDKILDLIELNNPAQQISNLFTPEALVKEMSERYDVTQKSCNGALIIDESRMWFENLDKDYMKGATPLLSLMWDGRSFSRNTMGGKKVTVTNPYLTTFLLGTPDVVDFFKKRYFQQGWANRIFYVLGTRKTGWKTGITPRTRELRAQLKTYIEQIFHNTNSFALLTLPKNLQARHEQTEEDTDRRTETESLGMMENWVGNRPEFILKVAGIIRLSHLSEAERDRLRQGTLSFIEISSEDYEYAVSWVNKCEAWLKKIVERIPEVSRASREQRIDNEFVFDVIKGAGKDGITQEMLRRKLNNNGINSDPRTKILQGLLDAQRIRYENAESSGGRKATKWFAV